MHKFNCFEFIFYLRQLYKKEMQSYSYTTRHLNNKNISRAQQFFNYQVKEKQFLSVYFTYTQVVYHSSFQTASTAYTMVQSNDILAYKRMKQIRQSNNVNQSSFHLTGCQDHHNLPKLKGRLARIRHAHLCYSIAAIPIMFRKIH